MNLGQQQEDQEVQGVAAQPMLDYGVNYIVLMDVLLTNRLKSKLLAEMQVVKHKFSFLFRVQIPIPKFA